MKDIRCKLEEDAVVRSGSVIYEGNKIGKNFQTGHGVLVRQDNVFGDNVRVGSHSEICFECVIEEGVHIHSSVFIPEFTILKKGCWLGPHVVITNSKYPVSKHSKDQLQKTTVGEGAKIGANATLLPGIEIGAGAIIGAGSVVTRDVPAGEVWAGNPAEFLKKVDELVDSEGDTLYEDTSG